MIKKTVFFGLKIEGTFETLGMERDEQRKNGSKKGRDEYVKNLGFFLLSLSLETAVSLLRNRSIIITPH